MLAIAYGLPGTAVSVNSDMTKGIINRFKVMNVSRGAVLTGHVAPGPRCGGTAEGE